MRPALLTVLAVLVLSPTASASRLVTYDRAGGLAGEMTSLVVERDRHAELDSRRGDASFTVPVKRYRALRRDLRAARFAGLRKHYAPDGVVSDGIDETVRFRGHAVTVSTGGDPPARLVRVLERLRALTAQ